MEKTGALEKPSKPKPIVHIRKVVVTDIDIKFWSMVNLIVKFTLASIPAIIIIYLIIVMFGGALVALVGR